MGMYKATPLYELENGVILRDGDKVKITTDGTEFETEYICRVEVTEDGLALINEEYRPEYTNGGSPYIEIIDFEYIVDVVKVC